jgi:hypothetical protein
MISLDDGQRYDRSAERIPCLVCIADNGEPIILKDIVNEHLFPSAKSVMRDLLSDFIFHFREGKTIHKRSLSILQISCRSNGEARILKLGGNNC